MADTQGFDLVTDTIVASYLRQGHGAIEDARFWPNFHLPGGFYSLRS